LLSQYGGNQKNEEEEEKACGKFNTFCSEIMHMKSSMPDYGTVQPPEDAAFMSLTRSLSAEEREIIGCLRTDPHYGRAAKRLEIPRSTLHENTRAIVGKHPELGKYIPPRRPR
jgi:hypothetical protein